MHACIVLPVLYLCYVTHNQELAAAVASCHVLVSIASPPPPSLCRVESQGLHSGGGAGLDWRAVSQQLLSLHLATPGLQLRQMTKLEEAATHILNTARVRGGAEGVELLPLTLPLILSSVSTLPPPPPTPIP
jgi:hypothetical protein